MLVLLLFGIHAPLDKFRFSVKEIGIEQESLLLEFVGLLDLDISFDYFF